jgi:hypothetical protein
MVKLEGEDCRKLIELLETVPPRKAASGRRIMLENAELEEVASLIALEGATLVVISKIVTVLANYGHINYDAKN